jgi:hypothetical protein
MNNNIYSVNTSEIYNESEDKRCAPNVEFTDGSCININLLIKIIEAFNLESNEKIILQENYQILNPSKYKKYLLKELSIKLNNIPQRKWFEQPFMKNIDQTYLKELNENTFRHDGPDGKFEWLNTLDINGVVGQYENKYTDFKFFGAMPIDFAKLDRYEINNLDYKNFIESGKSKIGIVFNLDEHWQSGSHWVALFADLIKGHIFFFDSYGYPPEDRIQKLMRNFGRVCEDFGIKPKNIRVEYNKYRHQRKNSECGVYSINFILRMLKGNSFEEVCKSQIHDDKINKCRNIYFKNARV